MMYRVVQGLKIPILGLGTWGMGGKLEPDYSQENSSIEAIQYAINLGITHIDTSEIYGGGFTEKLIGKAIKPYERSNLFITSKVWSTNLTYSKVLQAFESTLQRLKTDYLDLYLIHSPSDEMDLEGAMKALEYLNERRLARAIGLSNFTVQKILEAEEFLTKSKIFAVQNEYNLLTREQEIPILKNLADKYNKTSAQIAINWLVSKYPIVTIPKAVKKEHIEEIAASIGWQMSPQDYELLDSINKHKIEALR